MVLDLLGRWVFFLVDFFFFLLANLVFFFFREPSKREGVRVLERESLG